MNAKREISEQNLKPPLGVMLSVGLAVVQTPYFLEVGLLRCNCGGIPTAPVECYVSYGKIDWNDEDYDNDREKNAGSFNETDQAAMAVNYVELEHSFRSGAQEPI